MRAARMWLFPLVALLILAGVTTLPEHTEAKRPAHTVTVTRSSYACPTPQGTTVAGGRYASHDGASVTAQTLPGRTPLGALTSTTAWSQARASGAAVLVHTQDEQGAGAVGFTGVIAPRSAGGGLEISSCPGVVQDAWYLGAGSGTRHSSFISLTNLSDSPAVADLSLWGPGGAVDAVNAKGIVLKSFQTRSIRLDDLAAGEPELAVKVHSRRGALSVAMRDTSTAAPVGSEAIPATTRPALHQVIPGIAPGASRKQLVMVNPGDITARVKVEVLGKDGAIVPTGLDAVPVGAGRVKVLELPASVGNESLALRLSSDHRLSASVRMASTGKDYAYAVAEPALKGPAIVPLSIASLIKGADLVLTSPRAASRVTVTAYDSAMKKRGQIQVTIKADSTVLVDLDKKKLFALARPALSYVVVTGAPAARGSAIYTNGDRLSAVPLRPAPLETLAPSVRPGR